VSSAIGAPMTPLDDTFNDNDDTSVLSWLQSVADRSRADDSISTVIPVAWMGRTSTDDQQDPTLSLPRQLENCRMALPATTEQVKLRVTIYADAVAALSEKINNLESTTPDQAEDTNMIN
jgi:hypothetical protein